jgi:hypothetical protein
MSRYTTIKAPGVHTVNSAIEAKRRAMANGDLASIPTAGDACIITLRGQVAWLRLGLPGDERVRKHKFFLNEDKRTLTDYATGARVTTLNSHRIALMLSRGTDYRPALREVAQHALDTIIADHGLDKVLERLAEFDILND